MFLYFAIGSNVQISLENVPINQTCYLVGTFKVDDLLGTLSLHHSSLLKSENLQKVEEITVHIKL